MKTNINAMVTGWNDAGGAEYIQDVNGDRWHVVVDALDGTIAVEEVTHGERHEPVGRAGIFVWAMGSENEGHVATREDGDTYGINTDSDWVVASGEWVQNEEVLG